MRALDSPHRSADRRGQRPHARYAHDGERRTPHQARLRDRARERELRNDVRPEIPGAVSRAQAPAGRCACAEVLRHRALEPRQLHRDDQRTGAQSRHAGGLQAVHGLRSGRARNRVRRSGHRPGLRLPRIGPDRCEPARGGRPHVEGLHAGHGRRSGAGELHLRPPRDRLKGLHPGGQAEGPVRDPAQPVRLLPLDHRLPDVRHGRGPAEPAGRRSIEREPDSQPRLHHPRPLQRRARCEVRGRRPRRPQAGELLPS